MKKVRRQRIVLLRCEVRGNAEGTAMIFGDYKSSSDNKLMRPRRIFFILEVLAQLVGP